VTTHAGDRLATAEDTLLSDLAGQAGLVLRNVRLIEELRASRQRLVRAQDEERRRIERNIHDGAQQQLVAIAVKLRLPSTVVGRDSATEHELLDELGTETQDAIETLRDLARGIYPRCSQNRAWPRHCLRRPRSLLFRSRCRRTASGGIRRRSKPPCTSAAWRACRTWPSTPGPPAPRSASPSLAGT